MSDRRKTQKNHIRAARDWLGQAEHSLDRENDVQGDLKLMLAKAELSRVQASPRGNRLKCWGLRFIPAVVALAIAAMAVLWKKGPKKEYNIPRKRFYIGGTVCVAAVWGCLYGATIVLTMTGILGTRFGNLGQSYRKYGFAYCFSTSVVNRGISKSDEYSQEYIDSLKQMIDGNDKNVSNTEDTPNIIFLQLESFFDPKLVKGARFSENQC